MVLLNSLNFSTTKASVKIILLLSKWKVDMPERALYTKQLCSCVLYNNFDLYAKNPTSHLSHDERLGSNLPNIPTLCLMLLQFLSSAADGHKINAAEYQ